MTYRERREAKAERLREWADKREAKADGLRAATPDGLRHDWAFITQPGRIPERDRMRARDERANDHEATAARFSRRAAAIEAQADHAIYSDDKDAAERLTERIAELEAERDRVKRYNATARKGAPDYSLLAEDDRKALMSMARVGQLRDDRAIPRYHLTNLSANINRQKKRLEALRDAAADVHPKPLRVIEARRGGECERCGEAIEIGQYIGMYADGWSHVTGTTTWARCEAQ